MGTNHARVAAQISGCRLVGIYDADTARAGTVAGQFDAAAFATLDALCDAVDAVIIATPTATHAEVATACLRAGCHVLLEKPIAASVSEAEALLAVSAATDRIFMIGHVERFNPAIMTLLSLLDRQQVFACEFSRMSATSARDRSADVIFDLMIHDIDLALAITGSPATVLAAQAQRVGGTLNDHVTALLCSDAQISISLQASWVSHEMRRVARVHIPGAQYTVDLARRELWLHRYGPASLADKDGRVKQSAYAEKLFVPYQDPLVAEHDHFLHAIQTGIPPVTDGHAGLAALRLAYAIQEHANSPYLAIV